jgi:plasmid stabilization system protein ParE
LERGTSQARTPKVKRVRLTREAELDLDVAHAWYHAQSRRLAREFLVAFTTAIASVRRHPEAYQLVDPTMRRALLRRFPYAIFFEVGATEIVVYGVFHGARDRKVGADADEMHNITFDRTAGSRSLAAAGQRER